MSTAVSRIFFAWDEPLELIRLDGQSVIESHSETTPSLRLTNPFPALKQWADDLDYDALDPTDHGHVPFTIILVKEAELWKAEVLLRVSLPICG